MRVKAIDDQPVSPNLARGDRSMTCAYPFSFGVDEGEVICAYRTGRQKHSLDGRLVVQLSSDAGRTWEEPAVVFDGRLRTPPESVHTGVVCASRPGQLLAWFTTVEVRAEEVSVFSEGGRALAQHLYCCTSADESRTWTEAAEHLAAGTARLFGAHELR